MDFILHKKIYKKNIFENIKNEIHISNKKIISS